MPDGLAAETQIGVKYIGPIQPDFLSPVLK